jgi:peptidoglycan hydrolase-like protein with peptidoglycan-binding domain
MSETAYNGWPASRDPKAIGVDAAFAPAGVRFPGGVVAGPVSVVLGHVATSIHLQAEKLVPGWCWGYEYRLNLNDPSVLSVHAAGCAVDINAPVHGNGAYDTWSTSQVTVIRRVLNEVSGVVAWGRDWRGVKDEMHFEIDAPAAQVAAAASKLHKPSPPEPALHQFPLPAGYYFGLVTGPEQSISGMAPDGSDEHWRPSIARIQAVVHVATDGMYGPITFRAVRGWQAAHHVGADGLTGPKTWAAMRL